MTKAARKSKTTKLALLSSLSILLLALNACSTTQDTTVPPPSLNAPNTTANVTEATTPASKAVASPSQTSKSTNQSGVQYTVKKGDSLWKVAKMFNVSVNELAAYNNMDAKSTLKTGLVMKIPPAGLKEPKTITSSKPKQQSTKTSTTPAEKTKTSASQNKYTVKSGDTIQSVAKSHNISEKRLAKANALDIKASLKAGQKLIIPAVKASSDTTAKTTPAKSAEKTPAKATNSKETTLSDKVSKPVSAPADQTSSQNIPASQPAKQSASPEQTTTSSPVATPTANFLPHSVKDGDTWKALSDMYGVSIEDLKKANSTIAGDTQPKAGTVVNIPEQ
ncbi:MAG: LysM peptidoglycan-binding domain-containing protein [Lentisphaerota bacterium]